MRLARGLHAVVCVLALVVAKSSVANAEGTDAGVPDPPPGVDVADLDLSELLGAPLTTATKRLTSLRDSPVSAAVLTSDYLDGTGRFTLCDALQYVQGLSCRRGAMRKAVVGARGLSSNFLSNRLLLLRDGRPETDPWTGIFYPDETTPLGNVKQIEVLRGPGASLYGTNAFSGVINMVTRRPEDLIAEGHTAGVDARVMAGQYATLRAQATAAAKLGPVGALVTYEGMRSNGPELLSDPARGVVDQQEWTRLQHVAGKVTYGPATLDVGFTQATLGRPGGAHFTTVGNCGRCHYTPNDREQVQTFTASATVKKEVADGLELFGELYWLQKRREVTLENEIVQELQVAVGKRRRLGGEVRAVYQGEKLAATVGLDLKADTLNSSNLLEGLTPDQLGVLSFGAFADVEVRALRDWVAFVGARYDQTAMSAAVWKQPSSHLSPRVTLLRHLGDVATLSLRYGHSFRAPSPAELAMSQQMYGATLLGNPQLKAESLDSFEFSADLWPIERTLRLNVTGFAEYARGLISQQFLQGSLSQFENMGDARIYGLEAEASLVALAGTRVDAGYQYLRARSLVEGTETPLDYAPEHRIFLRAHAARGDLFFADLYAVYVTSRQDPGLLADGSHVTLTGYLDVSARVGVNVYRGISLSLFAANLFDMHYEESSGFPAAGLRLFGELKVTY